MKGIYTLLTAWAIILGNTISASAQYGTTSAGLRLSPDGLGFSGKHFVRNNLAFEAQFNAGGIMSGDPSRSYTVTGLLAYHIVLPDPRWSVYFGGGVHAGSWDHGAGRPTDDEVLRTGRETIFGVDGLGGVEYKLKSAPISFSADFKPAINLLSEVDFFPHNMFGISARVFLNQ